MSNESMGLGVAPTQFIESRNLAPSPARQDMSNVRKNPDAAKSETPQQQSLSPAETSEALADQAMDEAAKKQKENPDLSADELKDMLEEINNLLYSMNRALRFEIHDKTEDLIVRVVNTRTDEVIRQYPREDVLERREKLLAGDLGGFSTRVD